MKKILGLIVLISVNISVNAQQPQDSIFVIIDGDTVHIWNTGALENCASKFRMDISFSADTIFVVEVDTTDIYVPCMCYYDLCSSITGLQSGSYIVKVFRDLPLIFPDTLLYIGATSFAYGGSSISFTTATYQSDCDPITSMEENSIIPQKFELAQNFPNPFNPSTKIKYSISPVGTQHAVSVQLKVYDILGKEITILVNEEHSAGVYEIEFDASKLSSGIYFYRLTAGDYTAVKKMILIK